MSPNPAVLARAKASGAPVVKIQLADVYALGAEFLRWEVATATAGLLMKIHPFDEPNVTTSAYSPSCRRMTRSLP